MTKHVELVLDRSGSMSRVKSDVDAGVFEFIRNLMDPPTDDGPVTVSLHHFDTRYETVYKNLPPEQAPRYQIEPRGLTALMDAIGNTITNLEADIEQRPAEQRPQQVVVVIVTDGEENSSREYTSRQQIRSMIERKTADGWQFVYLGADQDAFTIAGGYGFTEESTASYSGTGGGTRAAFTSASGAIIRSRSGQPVEFTRQERDSMARGGDE